MLWEYLCFCLPFVCCDFRYSISALNIYANFCWLSKRVFLSIEASKYLAILVFNLKYTYVEITVCVCECGKANEKIFLCLIDTVSILFSSCVWVSLQLTVFTIRLQPIYCDRHKYTYKYMFMYKYILYIEFYKQYYTIIFPFYLFLFA